MSTTTGEPQLSYQQTISCALAHRRAVSEVFVTDSAQLDDRNFLVALQPPRGHSLWGDRRNDFHDPFALGEAARQAAFVVLHRHLGIPLDLPFTLHTYEFAADDLEAFRDDARTPLRAVLHYRISRLERQGERFGGLSLIGEITVAQRHAMTLTADVVFLPPGDHETLRAFQRSRKPLGSAPLPAGLHPVSPGRVGRWDERNVTIGELPDPSRFALLPDLGHPSYFDHEYDHVPGPFIVEGFRQAAVVVAQREGLIESPVVALTGCRVSFADFGEFGDLLECSAEPDPDREPRHPGSAGFVVGLHQFGKRLAEGRIELSPFPEK